MSGRYLEELTDAIWSLPGRRGEVFAIVDCARDPGIFPLIQGSPLGTYCLFAGVVPKVLAEAAPHLVPLRPGERFTNEVLSRGWGKNWGVFVTSQADVMGLRRHLRRYLMVADEQGKRMYFRYYDPRVLRVYLPTCKPDELDFVFGKHGPIDSFACEAEQRADLVEWVVRGGHLAENRFPIGRAGARAS